MPSLRRDADEWAQMLDGLGTLYAAGVTVDWAGFDRPYPRRRLALPTYPWEHEALLGGRRSKRAPSAPMSLARRDACRARPGRAGPARPACRDVPERWRLLDRLADAYIVRALRALGLFTRPVSARHLNS